MLLSGDEFANTQFGNNNAYCQDNEISWLDWGRLDDNREHFEFVKNLIAFRKVHPVLRNTHFDFPVVPEGYKWRGSLFQKMQDGIRQWRVVQCS